MNSSNPESQFSQDRDSRFFYQLSSEERAEFEHMMKNDDLYYYRHRRAAITEAMIWIVVVLVSFSVVLSIFFSVSTSVPLLRTLVFTRAFALMTVAIAFRLTPLVRGFLLNTTLHRDDE
jgi:hypothetical protein